MRFLHLAPFVATAVSAYTTLPPKTFSPPKSHQITRKALFTNFAKPVALLTLTVATTTSPSLAFDGSGSTAAGKTLNRSALKKSYSDRIVADVRDFNALGAAVARGELEGKAWINFFIPFKRREPDEYGRIYAAFSDLVGTGDTGGGCGLLYVGTLVKPGKPSEGTAAFKKFTVLSKLFGPIEAAAGKDGKGGSVEKAKAAWGKAAGAFEEFLGATELPGSLSDPIYS